MKTQLVQACFLLFLSCVVLVLSSSHSEAPGTASAPQTDATDFYMFRSYEKNRDKYVTFIANYRPFQSPYGGPNYFPLSNNHFYDIQIDNNGDAKPDIIFSVLPESSYGTGDGKPVKININGTKVNIPTKFVKPIVSPRDKRFANSFVNFVETYNVYYSTKPNSKKLKKLNSKPLYKPFDNAGTKTFPNYSKYSKEFQNYKLGLQGVNGCKKKDQARIFVGQRKESFAVNLGGVFDLVDFPPLDVSNNLSAFINQSSDNNVIKYYSVTSIVLEVPIKCLLKKVAKGKKQDPVIGAWTTTRTAVVNKKTKTPGNQISRLGNPLVNELVIGLKYKALFNTDVPSNDAQFATFVTNPTLPTILSLLFLETVNALTNQTLTTLAPTNYPRNDLVATFLTGIKGINQPKKVTPSEQLRLNTATKVTPLARQNTLGVIGGDPAGFPNGRRPGDDVTDIALDVVMGRLCTIADLNFCTAAQAPVGTVAFTDGAPVSASDFQAKFPYVNDPLPGNSPEFGQAIYNSRR